MCQMYMYIYIQREREKEKERHIDRYCEKFQTSVL